MEGNKRGKRVGDEEDTWQADDSLKTLEGNWYEGKLTRHNHFDALAHIDDALNLVPVEFADEDRRRFMASCFGHFLMMHREMKFSADIIHQLLLRELHHNGPTNEMHFMLGTQSVRFSKVKFYLITVLRFGVVPETTMYAVVKNGIHERYFPRVEEMSLEQIMGVVTSTDFGQTYDAVKLCLLYMMNWKLMGVDERFKILVWQFRLVEDLDEFDAFPWGAHVFRHSIHSFKHALDGRRDGLERRLQEKGADVHRVEMYNIYGLSHDLLIFALEVIPDLTKEVCVQRVTDLTPRILKWELTKQPRGKKLAKIFKARTGGGRRLYVEDDIDDMPPKVPDQTTLDGINGTDRTIDSEGSEPAAGGLRPSDSEGYETDPQRERHRYRRVRFSTPGHGTSVGDSRGGVGRDGEVS
ncbi:hypothetical protein Ddye_008990 [Dipteronia dyeriana]|uniref:DUF1985 domain-containing protein n=1 Tax=Dipteronia dyeriana TaxID=168575 RepID=A0AAD9XAS4_9ROSI|nr:hypothetical protein Ddye_008990 [Dipteronia dyeriana]